MVRINIIKSWADKWHNHNSFLFSFFFLPINFFYSISNFWLISYCPFFSFSVHPFLYIFISLTFTLCIWFKIKQVLKALSLSFFFLIFLSLALFFSFSLFLFLSLCLVSYQGVKSATFIAYNNDKVCFFL